MLTKIGRVGISKSVWKHGEFFLQFFYENFESIAIP